MNRKNKDFIYDIKIDLHGYTTMQAFCKTLDTIEGAYKSGARNILFITGVGNTERGTGAIRAEFSVYLDHPRVRDTILSTEYTNGQYRVRLRKIK
ncbi:MAG: Smr/MutS family protein [Rickettsiales bacterium]|nr:Smr/MutS family protein [Rickettsiales bacterium]